MATKVVGGLGGEEKGGNQSSLCTSPWLAVAKAASGWASMKVLL